MLASHVYSDAGRRGQRVRGTDGEEEADEKVGEREAVGWEWQPEAPHGAECDGRMQVGWEGTGRTQSTCFISARR